MATKDTGGQRQTTRRSEEAEDAAPEATAEVQERQEKLSDDVEAILDEIQPLFGVGARDAKAVAEQLADVGRAVSPEHEQGEPGDQDDLPMPDDSPSPGFQGSRC